MADAVPSSSPLTIGLLNLAQEKSSEKRIELLRRITDAYLEQPDGYSSAEKYLLNEIVTKLVGKIGKSDRVQAAASLFRMSELPDAVALTLATDDIEVARPIIRDYRGMREQDLIAVAKSGSQDHLQALAGRSIVTPPVSDVVVTRGDQRVVRTLAANQGAQFSSRGMETLIDKAAQDGDLQALIVERSDISFAAMGRLLPIISHELVLRLREKIADFDESIVSEHLAEWMEDRQKNVKIIDGYIEAIGKDDLRLNEVAMELIKNERLLDAASLFAALVDLDRYHTFNILTRGKTSYVLMLMRSMGLQWLVADAFLKLRRAKISIEECVAPVGRDEYEAIDIPGAKRVVRFLKVRRSTMATADHN